MNDMTAGQIILTVGTLALGLVVILRADQKDIPAVARELGHWGR